ncbi:MAG: efflux RND transporter periplasmic adaptor subunit [Myxococcales bacterium]|nr:efflux RND transporter periplasmic adaptor subunit [Myxococcales bacterium]
MSDSNINWFQSPWKVLAALGVLALLLMISPSLMEAGYFPTPGDVRAEANGNSMGAEVNEAVSANLDARAQGWLTSRVEPEPETLGRPEAADRESALDCLIRASDLIDVGSQTGGLIESIPVDVGDWVQAGELVVQLEADVERATVLAARTRASARGAFLSQEEQVALYSRRVERSSSLLDGKALSLEDWDKIQSEHRIAQHDLLRAKEERELAQFQLAQAEAVLKRRSLHSPVDGLVVARNLSAGEIVDDATILTIAQIDPLHADILLPATRFGGIRPGMRASLSLEVAQESRVIAEVDRVDPIIDAASGTFKARLTLTNSDRSIPVGTHCRVEFLN